MTVEGTGSGPEADPESVDVEPGIIESPGLFAEFGSPGPARPASRSRGSGGPMLPAPNSDRALAAIRALYAARTAIQESDVDGLSRALLDAMVVTQLTNIIDLLGLQAYDVRELQDAADRIVRSAERLDRAVGALQPFRPDAAAAMSAAITAVNRAMVH